MSSVFGFAGLALVALAAVFSEDQLKAHRAFCKSASEKLATSANADVRSAIRRFFGAVLEFMGGGEHRRRRTLSVGVWLGLVLLYLVVNQGSLYLGLPDFSDAQPALRDLYDGVPIEAVGDPELRDLLPPESNVVGMSEYIPLTTSLVGTLVSLPAWLFNVVLYALAAVVPAFTFSRSATWARGILDGTERTVTGSIFTAITVGIVAVPLWLVNMLALLGGLAFVLALGAIELIWNGGGLAVAILVGVAGVGAFMAGVIIAATGATAGLLGSSPSVIALASVFPVLVLVLACAADAIAGFYPPAGRATAVVLARMGESSAGPLPLLAAISGLIAFLAAVV